MNRELRITNQTDSESGNRAFNVSPLEWYAAFYGHQIDILTQKPLTTIQP